MMSLRRFFVPPLLIALALLNTGCPFAPLLPPVGTLNNLDALDDVDGDGFPELETPEGVDVPDTIAVSIVNQITQAEVEALAGSQLGINLPPGLTAGLGVTANFSITRVYEGGIEITDEGSRGLTDFTIKVEAACPQQVIAVVDVTAMVPFLGEIPVLPPQTIDLPVGDGSEGTFACGKVISVTAVVDDATGLPDINVSIEEQ